MPSITPICARHGASRVLQRLRGSSPREHFGVVAILPPTVLLLPPPPMQTFLPHFDFSLCAQSLDSKRLNKQRVECKQIYNALTNPDARGWVNHPAVRMWRGYERALLTYALAICVECDKRGIADNVHMKEWFTSLVPKHPVNLPPWLINKEVFTRIRDTHRAALVHKLPVHYHPQFPDAPTFTTYFWPV